MFKYIIDEILEMSIKTDNLYLTRSLNQLGILMNDNVLKLNLFIEIQLYNGVVLKCPFLTGKCSLKIKDIINIIK